jgi:hypothetical protein
MWLLSSSRRFCDDQGVGGAEKSAKPRRAGDRDQRVKRPDLSPAETPAPLGHRYIDDCQQNHGQERGHRDEEERPRDDLAHRAELGVREGLRRRQR